MRESESPETPFLIRRFKLKFSGTSYQPIIILKPPFIS
jgi:hypothetical protein